MFSWNKLKSKAKQYQKNLISRLKAIKATPYAIASGCACGVAISFTPFVGFHLVLAAMTAFLVRGSVVASAVGTIVGNPWTFAIIWPTTLYLGRLFLHIPHNTDTDFIKIFDAFFHSAVNFDFKAMEAEVWPIIYPMMIGSIPFYIAFWILSYCIIRKTLLKIYY